MKHGLYDFILVSIGNVLPPVARLAVYPMWKVTELVDDQRITVSEGCVLTELDRATRRR